MGNNIKVTMFGKFTICQSGFEPAPKEISLSGRSRRIYILIAYLILHRDRGVPAQELIDILWPGECGDNPLSTLQNNVSRARTALEQLGLKDAKKLIVNENGMYRWAPDSETELDCDLFEKLASRAMASKDTADGLKLAHDAIKIYTGDFLPDSAMESWCVHINAYYRSLYLRLCCGTAQRLFDEGNFGEAELLCNDVIRYDPSAEKFSVILMNVYISSGNPDKALAHFDHISRIYRDSYGVSPTEELEMMKSVAIQELYGTEAEESRIMDFLFRVDDSEGAMYCDNNVFREITRLRLRDTMRSHAPCQLVAFRLKDRETPTEKRMVYMRRLETTIQNTLRSSDPYTRVGAGQILLLLVGASRENAFRVIDRVMTRLHKDFPKAGNEYVSSVMDVVALAEKWKLNK